MRIHLLKLFINEFRKRRKKTALITFAIAWGTLSLLLMMSFGRGLSNQFRIGFSGLGIDLVMFSGGRTSLEYQGLPKGRAVEIHKEDAEMLKLLVPEIKEVSAEMYQNMTVTYGGQETNRLIHGVTAPFKEMRSMKAIMGGRFIDPDDVAQSRRVAFLGWNLAKTFFGTRNPVGENIYINRTPFTVVGVMKKKLQSSNYEGLDYDHVFIPLTTMCYMSSRRDIDWIHTQPVEKKYAALVAKKVKALLGKKYRFDKDDEYALFVWDTVENSEVSGRVFKGIEMFLGIIGGLTLLIAAVGVANLMYAVVKERTREIGVKMAMGAKRRHIVVQFLLEAFFIFLKGTFWGTIIAFNIVSLVRLIPMDYGMTSIQSYLLRPDFSVDILAMFVSVMGVLVFLSGIFPAIRASRLNPVDALRYE